MKNFPDGSYASVVGVEDRSHRASDWRRILAQAVRDPVELCRRLRLPPEWGRAAVSAAGTFPLLVPEPYLSRMRPGDPHDPLLAQVLPRGEELAEVPQFTADPLLETTLHNAGEVRGKPGLLRKYKGRLLIVASGVCAVHCRFCFRRHFPYAEMLSPALWRETLSQIAAEISVESSADEDAASEIILSGGDPLTLRDERLAQIARDLAEIPHIRRLRIHTRLPIVIPQRVTGELIEWLRGTRLATWMVVHANHPNEIDGDVAEALGRLVDAGVPVLNQTVLMRGVNDSADTLAELFERLVDLRVMPYYMHQLDRVAGTAHFEVPVERGREIMDQLRARLPGYAVPKYVREVPGAESKVPV